jgi:hypothetical protein
MMRVEQTIKITISEGKYLTLSKDEAEQLYTALSNALNKTSGLYYPPNTRNGNNNVLFAGGPIVAQGVV